MSSSSGSSRGSVGALPSTNSSPTTTISSQHEFFDNNRLLRSSHYSLRPLRSTAISCEDSLYGGHTPWILLHILHPVCAAELPLAIMFKFNSGEKPAALPETLRWWQLDRGGELLAQVVSALSSDPVIDNFLQGPVALDINSSAAELEPEHPLDFLLREENQDELKKEVRFAEPPEPRDIMDKYMPRNFDYKAAVPVEYVTQFCQKVFPEDYARAGFGLALIAMDYIRDIEFSRRSSLRGAGKDWGVTVYNWELCFTKPGSQALAWYIRMEKVETQMQKWWAEIYVGLRIYTMLDTLKQPLTRTEKMAMLNTLYPPVILSVPGDEISIQQLKNHRKIFFSYILAIEAHGAAAIVPIEDQLLSGPHSWRKVTLCLSNYLKHASAQKSFVATLLPSITPPTNPPMLDSIWIPEIDAEVLPPPQPDSDEETVTPSRLRGLSLFRRRPRAPTRDTALTAENLAGLEALGDAGFLGLRAGDFGGVGASASRSVIGSPQPQTDSEIQHSASSSPSPSKGGLKKPRSFAGLRGMFGGRDRGVSGASGASSGFGLGEVEEEGVDEVEEIVGLGVGVGGFVPVSVSGGLSSPPPPARAPPPVPVSGSGGVGAGNAGLSADVAVSGDLSGPSGALAVQQAIAGLEEVLPPDFREELRQEVAFRDRLFRSMDGADD